ncbi:MAG: AbrB/MazE/SpoVT family DNA-binding domain-containing protein [Oscillospiraceae bacterium]|nr:AbrB/MazE/SpoVT family DNA-binding domain-containing protein [Oscillospiraceae bacterium]
MVKSTGIVRQVDELGRVVIPIELRRNLNIDKRDSMEIFVSEDQIILKKYSPSCVFCSNAGNIVKFNEKNICASCLEKLKTMPLDKEQET